MSVIGTGDEISPHEPEDPFGTGALHAFPRYPRTRGDVALADTQLDEIEAVFESEVGDSRLIRAKGVERQLGLRRLYLKFEGGNPTGTQKDRIAGEMILDALQRGYRSVTLATCGNFGAAMAFAASLAGLRCVVHVPGDYHVGRVSEIEQFGAEIIRVPGDYETAVSVSRARAAAQGLYDANPGGENTAIQLGAYGRIAHEIVDELHDAPAAVTIPVSNGTTLAGVYGGFLSLFRDGRISRMPKMVAGSSTSRNPVIHAFLRGLLHCEDLDPRTIRGTAVNEPLINWHSSDGEQALSAIRDTGGWAMSVSDRAMTALSRLLRESEGLSVLPASTVGLAALMGRNGREPLPEDRYVVILTGRRQ
jgi:threonine synthase